MNLLVSGQPLRSIIKNDIKNLNLNTADKLKFLDRPAYPDEYLLVHFASRVYKEREDGQELPDSRLPEGWKLLTTAHNKENGYFGAAYWNPRFQQVVIAHRGTDPTNPGALRADIEGVLWNSYTPQINSAVTFTNKATAILNDLNRLNEMDEVNKKPISLQLSFTGHSLGGWLAQITTFSVEYLKIGKGFYFIKNDNDNSEIATNYHAHTVVFDSPGGKDIISKIKSDFDVRHHRDDNSLSKSRLDVTSYLSAPNLVNTCNSHFGTVYQIMFPEVKSSFIDWNFKYTLKTHSIEGIEKALSEKFEIKKVIDWPLVKEGIKKRITLPLLKFMFESKENEYDKFHKAETQADYINARYQVQDVDKTKCRTRIFTQPELEFLYDYQKLRQFLTPTQLQGLFSSFNDENTVNEAIEVLRSFEVENQKKAVRCRSEIELNKLISYVKNTLYFFPDVQSRTKNAQIRKPIWFDIRESVISFTGRQEELSQITSNIQKGIVVISGLSGVGKSELAIKYARNHYNQEDSVIWINAKTYQTMKESFYRLYKKLGFKTKDQDGEEKSIELIVEDIYKHFDNGKRLLIFDNAEKYSTIEKFLPLGLPDNANKPDVLITSPNSLEWKDTRVNIETFSLGDFTNAEAIEFVKETLGIEGDLQKVDIENLVKKLHNFPLTLQHAVTYIKDTNEEFQARNLEFKIIDYLKKYEQEPKKMLSIESIYDERTETILKTLKITLDKIKDNKEYGQQALDMLNIMSYFMLRNIPEEVFLNELASGDQERLISITRLLKKYSIVSLEQGMLNVHGLVQEVRRLELGEQQEEGVSLEEKTLERTLELLKNQMRDHNSVESYTPHIISVWSYASKYDKLIEDFIINGASNKDADNKVYTTYFHLITEGSDYEVVESIVNKIGSDNLNKVINAKNKDRGVPLHNAALSGDERVVKLLIEKGANINARKKHGWTPLHLAAKNGYLESVKTLLDNNANVNVKTGYEFTPLHLATQNGHLEVVRALLAKSTEAIDVETKHKYTALHLAAKNGHLGIVEVLLANSANINIQDKDGFTPLHWAVLNGHIDIVNKLLENRQVDVNAQTTQGNTPLHLAAEKDYLKIIEVLVKKGGNIEIRNKEGKTALNLASEVEVKDYITQYQQATFNRRQGTSGISGQLYEIELLMLLLLEGMKKKEDKELENFCLATNMEEAGDFDDVVFKYKYNEGGVEKSKIIFLQAKHRENPEKEKITVDKLLSRSDKGDFLLKKYFTSYRKIKQQFSEGEVDPIFGSKFEDSEFIIYTNALSTFSSTDNSIKEENINHFLKIADSQSKSYQLEFDSDRKEEIVNILEDASDCRRLAKELAISISSGKGIDMQKDIFKSYHIALAEKVIDKTSSKEGKLKNNFLNDNEDLSSEDREFKRVFFEEAGKVFNKQGDELKQELQNKNIKFSDKFGIKDVGSNSLLPRDLITENEIKEFLGKLKLFIGQPNEGQLGEIIKNKIKEVYGVAEQDIDSVFSDVEYKVRRWWKEGNDYLTEENKFLQESAKVSVWFDVKKPVELFTGRKEELSDLHSRVQRSSEKVTVISQMTSISGLGGIGKTELSRQYINENSKDYDNNIIWINAESEATLIESFSRLAKDKLRISTQDAGGKEKDIKSIVEEVYRFFAKRKSLFIFDNAEKNEYLNKFLPLRSLTPDAKKPYVLITSRNREWEKGIEVMDLNELKLEDAIEFVRKGLGIENESQDQEIKTLVEKLQRFPLAIQQAIAYIEDQRVIGEFSIDDYLEEYEKKTQDLLDSEVFKGIDNDYAKTTFTAWKITIDKIASNKEHGELALKVLNILAYFAPENISREMFLDLAGGDEKKLSSAVRLLVKYSMVNGEQKQSVLSIHRLVQEVIRLELKGQKKEEESLREALKLVETNLKKENLDHAVYAWNHAGEHIELVKEFSTLSSKVINKLDKVARYEEAYLFGTKALKLLESVLEKDHPDTLSTKHNIAVVLDKQGKHKEALQAYQAAYEKRKKRLGEDHPSTLTTKHNIGLVLSNQGEYEEALQTYRVAYEKRKERLGEDHPDTLTTKHNIATVLYRQGKHEEALQAFQEAYEKRKERLGEDHSDTLSTKNNIAFVLSNQGKYKEALQAYQAVYEKSKERLGEDHPHTLAIRNNIATVLDKQGKREEALQTYQAVYEKSRERLGEDHPHTLAIRNNIALVLSKQGEYDEALQAYQVIYDIQKRKERLGEDHPLTLITKNNIAGVLDAQGRYREALQAYQAVYDVQKRKEKLGEDHPSTLTTGHNIAGVLSKQGKYDEALQAHQAVYEKRKERLGEDHPDTLSTKDNIAGVLSRQGKYDEALQVHQVVYEKRKERLGEDHPDTLSTKDNIGLVLSKQGKYDEALQVHQAVYEKRKKRLGEDHPSTLTTKSNIAGVLFKQGKYDEALQVHQAVYEKRKKRLGEDHPSTLTTKDNIGLVLSKQGKYDEALQAYQAVYEKRKERLGEDHPGALTTRNGIAEVLEKQGKHADALKIFQEVYDSRKEILGPDHPDTLATQSSIEILKRKQSKNEEVFSAEECLSSISSGSSSRRKREAKECELSWNDVDEFNEEKEEIRDFSKIKINSDKFIDYTKGELVSEAKLAQLVQLADKVPVIGESQGLVSKLINNQKVINHLGKVGRVSGMVMHGMMAKNVLADFLNGDYQGVAINLGFIAGGQGFAKVAEAASLKGTELISGGKLFLGRSLRAASPFLARGTSAFIAYDLVNQIKEYKKGNNDALVGIIGDSIYLGVDVGEVGIEVAEAFGVLEGVSSITGPIGATIGAVVFVGTDVYLAVKRVDKIDEMIHLTTKERFIEGLRAFIGVQPEQYIEELMEEKQINNQLVNQGVEYLKKNNNIQTYIFPTGRSVTDSCRTVEYRERCPFTGLNICYSDGSGNLFVTKKREECTTKLQTDLDSTVLLDRKRTDIKWSRARPSDSGEGKFACLPQGRYESAPSKGAYLCKDAIGIEYTNNRTENNTLISLGKGNDTIVGFPHGEHIVVLDDGCKNVTLGDGNDTVLLEGSNITGIVRGGSGINTLDLENFAEKEKSIHVSLLKMFGYLYYEKGNEISGILGIHEINDILLRKGKQDRVYTDCNTKYVDGRGGESHNSRDNIIILNDNCAHEMKVIVRPYTDINNCAVNGSFTYIVPMANKGESFVNLAIRTDQQSNHKFIFNYTLYDVNNIERINNTVSFSFIPNVGHLRFEPREVNDRYTTDYEFNITNNAANSSLYQLSDGTEIKVGEKNLYAVQSTNSSVDEIINDYSTIANNLKMLIFVQSLLNNETVAIGHGNHDVLNNNPDHKSHLVGNGGENIFVVTCGHETMDESKLPIPEVVIYDVDKENLIDTLDLRQIKQQVSTDLNKEVKAKVVVSNTDLIIELLCGEDNQSIVKLRLKDALVTNWHERLHVIIDNVPMKIEEFELKPLPLIFDESDKNIIVIRPQDIEEGNKIVISKEMDNYIFARLGNDLIITNAFDRNLTGNEFCTISLNKFYQEEKMKTLTIKFADQEIVLKDHQVQVDTARYIDAVKREKKEEVYNDVFNNTRNEIIEANETITLNKPHQRSRRAIYDEEYLGSAATRASNPINDLFSWVKSSIGSLFNSETALPEKTFTQSSISQVDAQIDVNGTIMLLDVLVRKVTGKEYISTANQFISPLEAQGYALNITKVFEKVVEQAGLKSGVSMHRLNIDYMGMQKEITKKVMSGKFNEISGILKSYIEKACPGKEAGCPGKLSLKKFDKFIAQFSKGLLNQSIHQMLHNENNVLKMDNIKELQSLGLSGPRTRLDDVLIVGNPRELIAGRR